MSKNILKISVIVIILLSGLIIAMIARINSIDKDKDSKVTIQQLVGTINDNNVSSQLNDGKPLALPKSSIAEILDNSTNINSKPLDKNKNSETLHLNQDKLIIEGEESESKINTFVKSKLLSGEDVLVIPISYANLNESKDFNLLQESIKNNMLVVEDLKYQNSYNKVYYFIRNAQNKIYLTSKNLSYLDSLTYKGKIYWISLIQGVGGVSRIIVSEPNFANQITLSEFKDDLILSISKDPSTNSVYIVETTSGNGLRVKNTKTSLDLSVTIEKSNISLTK